MPGLSGLRRRALRRADAFGRLLGKEKVHTGGDARGDRGTGGDARGDRGTVSAAVGDGRLAALAMAATIVGAPAPRSKSGP